jgi:hypothetical protein
MGMSSCWMMMAMAWSAAAYPETRESGYSSIG